MLDARIGALETGRPLARYSLAGYRQSEDGAGQLAGVSRSRKIMTCEVLRVHGLVTIKLLTTRQPSPA